MTRIAPRSTISGSQASRARQPRTCCAAVALAVITLCGATASQAAGTEAQCQKARYDAKASYGSCTDKAVAKEYGYGEAFAYNTIVAKCAAKYAAVWPKLQARFAGTGTTCDQARFQYDALTVHDVLTGLHWERKTDDNSVHDQDNRYSWSAGGVGGVTSDGTVFTNLLATLNGGACFAGCCDWRLPTAAELQTILTAPYPCGTSPCVSTAIFGPTLAGLAWSTTTYATDPSRAWAVSFADGVVTHGPKFNLLAARAVRSEW